MTSNQLCICICDSICVHFVMDRHELANEKTEKIDTPKGIRANRQNPRHFHYHTTPRQFDSIENKISLSPHIALSATETVFARAFS